MGIYVQRQGEEYGPFEDADVKKHLAEGFLLSSDLARSDGDQDWTRLDDLVDARSRPPSIPSIPRQTQPRHRSALQEEADREVEYILPKPVVVKDISMSMESMVIFMVKWAIASIPAMLILWALVSIAVFIGGLMFQ